MSLVPIDDLNAETPMFALRSAVTPTDLSYLRSHAEPPTIDPETWRLWVRGTSELSLSLTDLQAMAAVSDTITMECAGNGRSAMDPRPGGTPWDFGAAGTAEYTGVPLATVLERAGIGGNTVEILFGGADSGEVSPGRTETYRRSLPLDAALSPDVLIAWAMGREPLTHLHGAPVRLVVPRWYAMASVKWLTDIEAIAEPFSGYYQDDRYTYDGEDGLSNGTPVTTVRVRSLIAVPLVGSVVAGPTEVAGTAWSGEGSIVAVAVSCDGGAIWEEAQLTAPASANAATEWRLPWTPSMETHVLVARATDSAGNTQPLESVRNEHGYGNNVVHRVTVTTDT